MYFEEKDVEKCIRKSSKMKRWKNSTEMEFPSGANKPSTKRISKKSIWPSPIWHGNINCLKRGSVNSIS